LTSDYRELRTHAPARRRRDLPTLLRLLRLAGPERGLLAAGVILLSIGGAMSLGFPQGMSLLIDSSLGHVPPSLARFGLSRSQLVNWAALVMALVALVQACAAAGRFILFNIAGERTVTRLRGDIYRRILEQEIAFFDS
jgi:ABC-type multidrug transport system fused ATPase/permease subunit